MELNTSHPLYGNLKFLFCVDESNNPVDLVTPSRVFTPHANSVRGTGPWGRHFGVRRSGSTATYGAALDAFKPANNTGTLLIVTHSIPYSAATSNASLIGGPNTSDRYLPRLSYSSAASGVVGTVRNATTASTETSNPSTTAYIGATPRMWTFTRNSTTAYTVYVNATAEVTGTSIGTDNTTGLYSYIGGTPGSATLEADIVWIAWFDVALTPTQISDLYASLGADNQFALVDSGASSTPVAFSGSVSNQTGTEGAAFSLGLSTYFSGTETPFAYSVQAGALPAGLSLNTSTGVISGTPTTAGVSSGIVIRATDATPDTADTNAFSITINAAGDAENPTLTGSVTFTSTTQTSYTAQWPAGSDNVAVTGYEYQIGGTAGAWADAGNNLSAAITGRTAGTTETVYVRGYDAAGLRSTPAISGEVTLLAATTDGTITVGSALYPIKYSSASVLNESGLRATVLDATTLAQVLNTSGVVCNAGVITITDAALVIGGTYHLAVKTASGWTGFSDVVTAS